MERFELDDGLKDEIRAGTLGEGFIKLVQSVRRNGKSFKIAVRPVEIGGVAKFQAEMTDDGRVQVKNFDADGMSAGLEEIIEQKGARDLHLMTAKGDLHVRVTKKGHVLVSRSAEMDREVSVKPHDRVKNLPLASFDSAPLLRVTGIADGEGKIRASMRGKYDQVNEFLKVVKETLGSFSVGLESDRAGDDHDSAKTIGVGLESDGVCAGHDSAKAIGVGFESDGVCAGHDSAKTLSDSAKTLKDSNRPFTVVDCGCGKAYLTLALYFYLAQTIGFRNVRVVGVDRRDDVIDSAKKMARSLDVAEKVLFVKADLSSFSLKDVAGDDRADMVVSLHACDTATDEAMARGVEWKAKYILSAPCCQHELQKSLASLGKGGAGVAAANDFAGLLRQSILRERLCDILTDSFRAMILRILGFRTQVIEFVSSEATMRNVLIKSEWGVKPGQAGPVSEYLNLRDYWKVTPWLETRLCRLLERHLARFD